MEQVIDLAQVTLYWLLLNALVLFWRSDSCTFRFEALKGFRHWNKSLGYRRRNQPLAKVAAQPGYSNVMQHFFGLTKKDLRKGVAGSDALIYGQFLNEKFRYDRGEAKSARSMQCVRALTLCILWEILFAMGVSLLISALPRDFRS